MGISPQADSGVFYLWGKFPSVRVNTKTKVPENFVS